jgi:hypothetical protein
MAEKILLTHGCAPGDITCLTALPRDIAAAYPGRFEILVNTHCKPLWDYNPHVRFVQGSHPPGVRHLPMSYGRYIREANHSKLHFVTAFHRDFQHRTGIEVPCLQPKGDFYLQPDHLSTRPIEGRYWVVIAGGKSDFTTKVWSAHRWQQVVNKLKEAGIHAVQCGARHRGHSHPVLEGVLDLVGRTDLRELLWILKHADGCIVPVTFAMHAAAALDIPCVCIAGGREHWWWEAYVNVSGVNNFGDYCAPVKVPHRYLHTQGLLDCCLDRGCWRNKILKKQRDSRNSYCKYPVPDELEQIIPKCLHMISVEHVVEAVMSYYEDGTLPPIGKTPEIKLPGPPPPPRITLPSAPLDLFAPMDKLLEVTQAVETPDAPKLLAKFKQDKNLTQLTTAAGPRDRILDHKLIGGRYTICVLMYGDYHDLHKACLNSILRTVPPKRRQLRIATNAICQQSKNWLDRLHGDGEIHTLMHNRENIKKYPAMRKLFHDPANPITDRWVIWFDDDSICSRDDEWWEKLGQVIVTASPKHQKIVGSVRIWNFNPAQLKWMSTRPWYRNRPWQLKNGREAPNGNKVLFACGGFWAAEMDALRAAMVPDEQIGHNGGDYMVGAQLWQAGYGVYSWNNQKQFVHTSSVGRRGLKEVHTGMPGWRPGGIAKVG